MSGMTAYLQVLQPVLTLGALALVLLGGTLVSMTRCSSIVDTEDGRRLVLSESVVAVSG